MNSLDILPVKPPEINKSKQMKELPESIPNVYKGQLLIVVGAIRSGKSTLLNTLILRNSFYNDMFDNVTIISPTIQNDQTSRFLYEKYRNCHTEYTDEIIDGVVKRQLEKIDNKEDTSYWIVLTIFGQPKILRITKSLSLLSIYIMLSLETRTVILVHKVYGDEPVNS